MLVRVVVVGGIGASRGIARWRRSRAPGVIPEPSRVSRKLSGASEGFLKAFQRFPTLPGDIPDPPQLFGASRRLSRDPSFPGSLPEFTEVLLEVFPLLVKQRHSVKDTTKTPLKHPNNIPKISHFNQRGPQSDQNTVDKGGKGDPGWNAPRKKQAYCKNLPARTGACQTNPHPYEA